MADLNIALRQVFGFEGIYSNDKNDLGGMTYMGISYNMHPKWKGWSIVLMCKRNYRNFPDCLANNLKLQELVEDFYRREFWDELRGDEIRIQTVANQLFDMAVNAGISTSLKCFQRSRGLKETGRIDEATWDEINLIV